MNPHFDYCQARQTGCCTCDPADAPIGTKELELIDCTLAALNDPSYQGDRKSALRILFENAYRWGAAEATRIERQRWENAAKRVIGHDTQLHTRLLLAVADLLEQ